MVSREKVAEILSHSVRLANVEQKVESIISFYRKLGD